MRIEWGDTETNSKRVILIAELLEFVEATLP